MRRAVSARRVYAVSAESGLARAPSRRLRGRDVTLMWSEPDDARRWLAVQPGDARLQEIAIDELFTDMLPAFGHTQRLVGVDWAGEEKGEPEFEPADLAGMLRQELMESFLARVVMFGAVWTLGDVYGLVQVSSQSRPGHLAVPCWSDERQASQRIDGDWSEAVAMRIRMDDFVTKTLPGLAEIGTLVAPEHLPGPGAIEVEAADLRLRIGARRVTGLV